MKQIFLLLESTTLEKKRERERKTNKQQTIWIGEERVIAQKRSHHATPTTEKKKKRKDPRMKRAFCLPIIVHDVVLMVPQLVAVLNDKVVEEVQLFVVVEKDVMIILPKRMKKMKIERKQGEVVGNTNNGNDIRMTKVKVRKKKMKTKMRMMMMIPKMNNIVVEVFCPKICMVVPALVVVTDTCHLVWQVVVSDNPDSPNENDPLIEFVPDHNHVTVEEEQQQQEEDDAIDLDRFLNREKLTMVAKPMIVPLNVDENVVPLWNNL